MIQFISHHTDSYTYLDSIRMALEGGCRWVQLRMKDTPLDEIVTTGREVRRLCDKYGATFIIDDHVSLVSETGADGVHLGQKDMPVAEARAILGDKAIIGGTANTIDEISRHYGQTADYVGCGPFRFTTTKKGLAPILGIQGYRDIVIQMGERGIDIPLIAIGGITARDIQPIMQTGVAGIAVSGTVLTAASPVAEMRRLMGIMESIRHDTHTTAGRTDIPSAP